jgi:hypothetical protein
MIKLSASIFSSFLLVFLVVQSANASKNCLRRLQLKGKISAIGAIYEDSLFLVAVSDRIEIYKQSLNNPVMNFHTQSLPTKIIATITHVVIQSQNGTLDLYRIHLTEKSSKKQGTLTGLEENPGELIINPRTLHI